MKLPILAKMSRNNRANRVTKIITVLSCSLLVVASIIAFHQQIPTVSKSAKIYDKEYINALRYVGNLIPQNETLTTSENYPQVAYFSDHKVKVAWVDSERSLVQFMWKINSSYLLVPIDLPPSDPDNIPLLIQLVEKPFEKLFDYYYDFISPPKPRNILLEYKYAIKEKPFEKLFEKITDYNAEGSVLHLYHLRSNITNDNLSRMVTDSTRPLLFVLFPVNGTTMELKSNVPRLNITGVAMDAESGVKKVEISVNDLVYQLAKPRAPDDWSAWSFSYIITSEGTKKIIAKVTDNADNLRWIPFYITIR